MRVTGTSIWAAAQKVYVNIKEGAQYVLRFQLDIGTANGFINVPVYNRAITALSPNWVSTNKSGEYVYRFKAIDDTIRVIFELTPNVTPGSVIWVDNVTLEEEVIAPTAYRFAFNGQERDDEVSGVGNSYTAEFWQYDSRLGRRFNIDPIRTVSISPYATFYNSPIILIDPSGLSPSPGAQRRAINRAQAGKAEWAAKQGVNIDNVDIKWNEGNNSYYYQTGKIIAGTATIVNGFASRVNLADRIVGLANSADESSRSGLIKDVGVAVGQTVTEFHPAVPIYNIGSKHGWWGNGNDIFDNDYGQLGLAMDYASIIPGGGGFKSAKRLAKLMGKYRNLVEINTAAVDVINNGLHFKFADKVHVALKLSSDGDVILGPAMMADAAHSQIDEAINAVYVMLNDPKTRQKAIDTARGFLNDGNIVKYPERVSELKEVIKFLETW